MKTREEEIQEARLYADKCKSFVCKFKELSLEANEMLLNRTRISDLPRRKSGLGFDTVVKRLANGIEAERDVKRRHEHQDRLAAEELKRKEKEAEQKKQEEEQQILVGEAIAWLQVRGKVLNVDFTVANAIATADEIAFNERVERFTAEGGFISFCGDDNCENCEGWDMNSRRCQCENRRVSWSRGYGHSFKEPYVYAEAW